MVLFFADETKAIAHPEDEVLDIGHHFFFQYAFVFCICGADEVHEVFVTEYQQGVRFKGREGFVEVVG
jgi:hypothetical protein